MNSHNTDPDTRHFCAVNIVCVLVLTACLAIWLAFKNGTEAKDVYTSWGAFLLVMLVGAEWVLYLLKQEERIFAAIGAWWEHSWLRHISVLGGGRFTKKGVDTMVASGDVKYCGFTYRDGHDPKVVPPEPPED